MVFNLPRKIQALICFLFLIFLATTFAIFQVNPKKEAALYFLPVGQGDSSLVISSNGEKILIDAGPGESVTHELAKIISPSDHYLDVVIISHTDKDHIAGFISVLEKYDVGIVLGTGRNNPTEVYQALRKQITEKQIPFVGLQEGDSVRLSGMKLSFLAPSAQEVLGSAENETSLVFKLETSELKALYTGDISTAVEERITKDHDVDVDILKVAHHGSKFSSSQIFLQEVTPLLAVI